MHEGRTLIERYWIERREDKLLFDQTRRELPRCQRFYTEQLGWRVIINERILKLEKIPAVAESFMGIQEFTEISDYAFLCALLVFLDGKEEGEQFLLSEIIDFLGIQLKDKMEINWEQFSLRKSLIRALKFAEDRRFIIAHEEQSLAGEKGIDREVLYENTGLSRYFATNFGYDMKAFTSYRDFERYVPEEADADRGHFRINRVYRQLVAAPAFYWQGSDDQDSLYVKNQRTWIAKTLEEQLGGQLHVHLNSAYFVLDENNSFGASHPRPGAMLPEIVLLLCGLIYRKVKRQEYQCREGTLLFLSRQEFSDLLKQCQEKRGALWSKEFREMSLSKLVETVQIYMAEWMMLKATEEGFIIYPGTGKLCGIYDEAISLPEGSSGDSPSEATHSAEKSVRKKKSRKKSKPAPEESELSLF